MLAHAAARKAAGAIAVPAVLFAMALPVAAQNQNQNPAQNTPQPTLESQPTPNLTITAREVQLDVVVTDEHHRPVTGLNAGDFTITEEGQPQSIRHLEEHSALSAADVAKLKAAPPLPQNTFTNFTPVENSNAYTVILLDALNTPISAQMYLREQLIDYLKHDMAPGTPIAIFQMDTEMRLIQGFTTDPQVLLAAADSKRDMPSLRRPVPGDRDYYNRMKTETLAQGMSSIGKYLAAFPGRKNLVWFTGSLPVWLMGSPTLDEVTRREGNVFRDNLLVYDDPAQGITDALGLSRVAVYPIDARGLEPPPIADASRRGPPRNVFSSAHGLQHMQLDEIADATGGKAYYNTNGLKQSLAQIVDNGSNYYTLTYTTTNQKWNGEFRHIKIRLNRSDLALQYRPGYYAMDESKLAHQAVSAQEENTPASPTVDQKGATIGKPRGGFEAAMDLGAVPPTEIVFVASVAIDSNVVKLKKDDPLPKDNYLGKDYKGKPFRNYAIVLTVDPRSLNLPQQADGKRHGDLQFVSLLYTPDGEVVNSLNTNETFALSNEKYRQMLGHAIAVKMQIAVPVKGNYFLRVGIHDLNNNRVGAVEIPVDQVREGVTPANVSAMAARR